MSFLVGKTQARSNVTPETGDLFKQLIQYIQGQGFAGLNPGTSVDAASAEPYQKLFRDQNAQTFGQAKESAGNLTGSGLETGLGQAAQRASTEQGSFLANLFENRRQQDAGRFLQLVLGSMSSPAAGVQYTHKPGLLDYASQAAVAAAPFFAPGVGSIGAGAAGAGAGAGAVGSIAPFINNVQRGNQTQSGGY